MSFTYKTSPYIHWEFVHDETFNRLRIVPERGGLITEWSCRGKEIFYFDRERFAKKDKSVRGGMPILFPICGGLLDNVLPLPQGNFFMRQHGFARDVSWKLDCLNDFTGVRLIPSHSG